MIKPIDNRILISPIVQTETASGILLPPSLRIPPNEGIVVSVSDLLKENVSVGDKVIYSRYEGMQLEDEGKKYLLLNIENVLAIISE